MFTRCVKCNDPLPEGWGCNTCTRCQLAFTSPLRRRLDTDPLTEEVAALRAVVHQYRASMERYERLGRACRKWRVIRNALFDEDCDRELRNAIEEWLAGEPKEAKEAR